MKLDELARGRLLILGLGREGLETYRFVRARFPARVLGLADRMPRERLAPEVRGAIAQDRNIVVHCGDAYLDNIERYQIVIRSPGVALITPQLQKAIAAGVRITSQAEIFLDNCSAVTVGVTGTKGKSTTASLIDAMLKAAGLDSYLVGNIGVPPLGLLPRIGPRSHVVMELSSYQLDGIGVSPHIAVLLNIVPEHLDLHGGFDNYVRAKQNIARFQGADDVLVFNAMYPLPRRIAASSRARRFGFAFDPAPDCSTFVRAGQVVCGGHTIMPVEEVALPGRFNLQNVMAAISAACVLNVPPRAIARAVREFRPLRYRLEPVGTFRGVTFYNDPLATIPQAAIAALDALGAQVATMLLGGYDRGVDMDDLARRVVHSEVKTVILFPPSGERIWDAIERLCIGSATLPRRFIATDMRTAVSIAYETTPPGRICLHSPASPSFGLFRDYVERGELFARWVVELGAGGE